MNGLKIASCCSCGTPMPVSDTLNRRMASSVGLRLGFDGQHHLAVLGELDGVPHEIRDDLAQAAGVADQGGRHVGTDVAGQLQSLHVRPRGQQFERRREAVAQVERDDVDGELVRPRSSRSRECR